MVASRSKECVAKVILEERKKGQFVVNLCRFLVSCCFIAVVKIGGESILWLGLVEMRYFCERSAAASGTNK